LLLLPQFCVLLLQEIQLIVHRVRTPQAVCILLQLEQPLMFAHVIGFNDPFVFHGLWSTNYLGTLVSRALTTHRFWFLLFHKFPGRDFGLCSHGCGDCPLLGKTNCVHELRAPIKNCVHVVWSAGSPNLINDLLFRLRPAPLLRCFDLFGYCVI
jgi:hypothetical protein